MLVVKKTLGKEVDKIKIVIIQDYHIGDPLSDRKKIEEDIKEVRDNKNTYAVVNGDIFNWASKTSVSDVYTEVYSPMDELNEVIELLKPIKDKILTIQTGNHERRAYKSEGIDLMRIVAQALRLESVYSNASTLLWIRLGNDKRNKRVCYKLYITHGARSGRKEGSKMQACIDMESIIDADVYIMGHTHLTFACKLGHFRTNDGNSSVSKVDVLFLSSGAKLKYGGYGEIAGFRPLSEATAYCFLDGKTRNATGQV